MTRIKVFPNDIGACGSYRIIWPTEILQAQGHDIELIPTVDGHSGLKVMVGTDGHVGGIHHPDCDVIVLQRPMHRLYAESIPFYQRQGVRVVVELDDDIAGAPTDNDAFWALHPRADVNNNWQWLKEACRLADAVVCTTSTLARKYGGGKGIVVPNYIPSRYGQARQPIGQHDDVVHVGWAGNLEVHRGDLRAAGQGVANALASTGATFRLVGTDEHLASVAGEFHLDPATPVEATGWLELDDYPKGLASLDVGLVPLASHQFNDSKSWLKGLEYASVGVPFVASDTEPYRALAALGIGEIARRPKDWNRLVRRLVSDRAYRQDRADAYFERARELTVERNAWRFLEAWTG